MMSTSGRGQDRGDSETQNDKTRNRRHPQPLCRFVNPHESIANRLLYVHSNVGGKSPELPPSIQYRGLMLHLVA